MAAVWLSPHDACAGRGTGAQHYSDGTRGGTGMAGSVASSGEGSVATVLPALGLVLCAPVGLPPSPSLLPLPCLAHLQHPPGQLPALHLLAEVCLCQLQPLHMMGAPVVKVVAVAQLATRARAPFE